MANLNAKEDIWVPREPYGRRLIARKGQVVPARYRDLLTPDAKRLTSQSDGGSDAAPAKGDDAYADLNQKQLADLVKERGLTTESQRKQDLLDALHDADENGAPDSPDGDDDDGDDEGGDGSDD